MDKTKKTQKNKMKRSKKPASKRKTAADSTDNTNEGEIDGMKIMKDSNRSSDDLRAAYHSPQTAHEGKNENKDRCTSTSNILAVGYSPPESIKVRKKGEKDYNTSTCKVQTVEQKSESTDSDLLDKMMKETNEKMEESARSFKVIHEKKYSKTMHSELYKFMLDFFTEKQLDIKKLCAPNKPVLVEHYDRCLDIMRDQYNRRISAEDALTAPKSQGHEETSVMKELENDGNENITSTPADTESYSNEIIIIGKNDNKKGDERSNDKNGFSDDVQKAKPSPQKVLKRKKCEKGNKYADTILASESSPWNIYDKKEGLKRKDGNISNIQEMSSHERELEIKDEMLIGQIDDIEENLRNSKNIPELKHSKNTDKNISTKQNDDFNHDLMEFLMSQSAKFIEQKLKVKGAESTLNILKEEQHTFSREKETVKVVEDTEANLETRVSKQLAGQANDAIKDLGKAESETIGNKSKTESDRSTGYIQAEEHSQPNETEGKKDGKNGRKDKVKSNEDHQNSHFDKDMQKSILKTKERLRKEKDILQVKDPNNMTKSIIPKETIIKKESSDGFLHDLEDFLRLPDFELDAQVRKCRGVEQELKFVMEEQDPLSSDIGTARAAEKIEIHEEAKVPTDLEYEVTQEIRNSGKRNTFLTEKITHLEEREELIHFEFETNGNKHILTDGNYYFLKGGKPKDIRVEFEKENIEISFIGSLIFISTKNSEFEISVRKPNFANQTDDATQTDILQ